MVTYSAHIKLNLHCVVGRTQALHDSFCSHSSARLNDDQGDMPHRHLVNWLQLISDAVRQPTAGTFKKTNHFKIIIAVLLSHTLLVKSPEL